MRTPRDSGTASVVTHRHSKPQVPRSDKRFTSLLTTAPKTTSTTKGDRRSIVVLGSEPYRMWLFFGRNSTGAQSARTDDSQETRISDPVMINYNPETVSTDYDMCDRLYFDELTLERVLDITDLEMPHGVIVSTGGQIPNNLAMRLDSPEDTYSRHLGTRYRPCGRPSQILVNVRRARHRPAPLERADIHGRHIQVRGRGWLPVLIRPSYVLSGAAMNVVSNKEELKHFLEMATEVSKQYPVVVTEFIENAKEIEIDAVAKDGEMIIYAISEHVEFAGVHSGDATIVFPAQKLYNETIRRIKEDRAQDSGRTAHIGAVQYAGYGQGQRYKGDRVQPARLA